MKMLIFILIVFLNHLVADDELLNGYSSFLPTTAKVELDIKPSFEKAPLKDKYETVVFVFMNGVNDLGILNFSVGDINEMEMIGSTDRVAVIVEHNRIEKDSYGFLKFGRGAQTYFIDKDTSSQIVSRIIDYTPDGDMGSARHFAISAKKVLKRFKPDRFIVILWNHGNGYIGIAYDDVSGNSMNIKDLSAALSEIQKAYGRKIDIFAMDACLMQMAEVVAEIKDYASFIVASQEIIPGPGYPYDDVLKVFNTASSVREMAVGIVEKYYEAYSSTKFGVYEDKDITLSAIDTSEYSKFISLLNRWVLLALNSADFEEITSSSVKKNVFLFGKKDSEDLMHKILRRSADLVDYLENAMLKMKDDSLKNETVNLIDFIKNNLVIHHKGGRALNFQGFPYNTRTYGIAIYLPKLRYNSTRYEGLKFCELSLWDEFIKRDLSDEVRNTSLASENGLDLKLDRSKDLSKEEDGLTNLPKPVSKTNISSFNSEKEGIKDNNGVKLVGPYELKNSQTQLRNESVYAKMYSTLYTKNKTLVPTAKTLFETSDIKKSVSLKDFSNKTVDEQNKDSSSLFKNLADKSQKTAQMLISNISSGASKIRNLFFEDKEKKDKYLKILEKFELEISTYMSVKFSQKLLNDQKLQKELLNIDRNRASKIISYAQTIVELDEVLLKGYYKKPNKKILSKANENEDVNALSEYLSSTLDRSKEICILDICVPPENLIEKMMKSERNKSRYNNSKITFTEKAIRKWNYIFGDETYIFRWDQARGVSVSSQSWLNMSVKERNAALKKIPNISVELMPAYALEKKKTEELKIAVSAVAESLLEKGFFTATEFNAIKGKSYEEQAYILANFFDRSGIKNIPELSRSVAVINANRTSFVNEVIDDKSRTILSNYVSNNIKNELLSSKTASDLYNKVYAQKLPSIVIDYTGRNDSKLEGDKIIIDASLIEQYMRMKGYTVESFKDEKVRREIMAYISPVVVKEMAAMYIASNNKSFSFDVREKYATALLYQAKYIKENKSLKSIFSPLYGYVDYADRIDSLMRLYRTSDNKDDFIEKAGLRYYSHLQSSSVARSEMLLAITKEIEKRSKMSADERKRVDEYALFTYDDIQNLTPFEISAHASDFTTEALLKLQQMLLSQNNFASFYDKIISSL